MKNLVRWWKWKKKLKKARDAEGYLRRVFLSTLQDAMDIGTIYLGTEGGLLHPGTPANTAKNICEDARRDYYRALRERERLERTGP